MTEKIICSLGKWELIVPQKGLTSDALCIRSTGNIQEMEALYDLKQKVSQFMGKKGHSYLWYHQPAKEGGCDQWHMVPYYGNPNSFCDRIKAYARQFLVMARVIWGPKIFSVQSRDAFFKTYQDIKNFQTQSPQTKASGTDNFCKKTVIDAQQIKEGTCSHLLLNYAPIGPEQLHFLLIPENHKETFAELSVKEFTEIQENVEILRKKYPSHTCFEYHKTGKLSGQTVPHFHDHVVFVRTEDTLRSKLSVFWRMIKTPTPLSKGALAEKVSELKKSLLL